MQEDLILSPPAVPRFAAFAERVLDAVARPAIGRWSAFRVLGVTGMIGGTIVLGTALRVRGVAVWPALPLLIVFAIVAFLVSVFVEKLVTGREKLTYYHHLLALAPVLPLTAWMTGLPLLLLFDACALALGTTLFFCRLGCTCAGCCRGRVHAWGVRYDGARYFPILLVEALAVALLVVTAFAIFAGGAPGGAAGTLYVVGYAVARMWIERGRGNATRRMFAGLYEAQWISIAIVLAVAIVVFGVRRPQSALLKAATAVAALQTVALLAARRPAPHPAHDARVTSGVVVDGHDLVTHYAVSRGGAPLSDDDARAFARHMQLLRHRGERAEIVRRDVAVHVFFRRAGGTA